MKDQRSIEWGELLILLDQYYQSEYVRAVWVKNNTAAMMVGANAEEHVNIDIFVFYYHDNNIGDPLMAFTNKLEVDLVSDFKGKIWNGLNIANLWKDNTVRLYNVLLYWTKEQDESISQFRELAVRGFDYDGSKYVKEKGK